jgi:hypothetical protein
MRQRLIHAAIKADDVLITRLHECPNDGVNGMLAAG